jgi:hypothetical protein
VERDVSGEEIANPIGGAREQPPALCLFGEVDPCSSLVRAC